MIMFSFTDFPKPLGYLLLELSMLPCKTEKFNSAESSGSQSVCCHPCWGPNGSPKTIGKPGY